MMKFPVLTLVLATLVPASCATTGTTRSAATLTVKWPVDNLKKLGGYSVNKIGKPTVTADAGGAATCFDGKGDLLIVPVSPLTEQSGFSIEMLVKPQTGGLNMQQVLHIDDGRNGRLMLEIHAQADGRWRPRAFVRLSEDDANIAPTVSHPADQWHWVALTYGNGQLRHYVNGQLQGETQMAILPMNPGEMAIGARLTREHWFKGCVRELRFANDALPEERLARELPPA